MAGGLLNLVANGSDNVLTYGNPTKTFLRKQYKKITNFGMQKIRIDYDGQRTLGLEKVYLNSKYPVMQTYLGMPILY